MVKFPKPSPNKDYEILIQKGFEKYPKRKENYEKFLKNNKRKEVDYYPIKLDIEPTSKCNLRCHMCIVSSPEHKGMNLSFEDFKNILDKQIGVFEIKVQGLGEPFLNKDFVKMVEYASSLYIWTRSTTNATLLHKDDNYQKIIDADIGELQISIDGVKKETYSKIRINSDFDRVVENCKLINNYQKLKGVQKTRMWVLLQKDNYEDLFEFPYFAKELGFDRLTISIDVNGWGNEEWDKKNAEKRVMLSQEDIDKLLKIAKNLDIELTFWDTLSKYNKNNLCLWPFSRFVVTADKKIVPCCLISDPKVINFGDIDKFEKYWFGDKYQNFRQQHISGEIPPFCKFCYDKE